MNEWEKLKSITETKWLDRALYEGVSGYQIQPGTKWQVGLAEKEIEVLEGKFGFQFPYEYKKMLATINGFDRPNIELYDNEENFDKTCYTYPEDCKHVVEFINDLENNIEYVKFALESVDLNDKPIIGFIPLYSHRAMVVTKNKSLSPVVSCVGSDVILYEGSLLEYWQKEFDVKL